MFLAAFSCRLRDVAVDLGVANVLAGAGVPIVPIFCFYIFPRCFSLLAIYWFLKRRDTPGKLGN
jgi:hypothetical protein